MDEESEDQETLDEKTLGEEALDEKALDEKALDEKALDEEALDEEALGEEALSAQGGEMLVDAVGQLSPEDVDRLLRSVPSPIATEVVKDLIGNKLDPRRIKKLGPLLVGPLRKRPAARLAPLVERLSGGIFATFEAELGDRFGDPSQADLEGALGAVLAQHPTAGVRCTLCWVVAGAMNAAEVAHAVLLTDERLCLPDWPRAQAFGDSP